MSVAGKRVFPSIVESVIAAKSDIQERTADTIRSDSAAILEALVADLDESAVLDALRNQGFASAAYRSTLRALAEVARTRRAARVAGRGDADA